MACCRAILEKTAGQRLQVAVLASQPKLTQSRAFYCSYIYPLSWPLLVLFQKGVALAEIVDQTLMSTLQMFKVKVMNQHFIYC